MKVAIEDHSPSVIHTHIHTHIHVDSLDSLEEHEKLNLAGSAIEVSVTGCSSIVDSLEVHRRSHSHHEAKISISEEEFLSLQLS